MKVRKIRTINLKYTRNYLKPYINIKLTFDEATAIKDYIKSTNLDSAHGLLKSKLEKILK